jgi:hypothetical protein
MYALLPKQYHALLHNGKFDKCMQKKSMLTPKRLENFSQKEAFYATEKD